MPAARTLRANRDLQVLLGTWAAVTVVRWAQVILLGLYGFELGGAAGLGAMATIRLLAGGVASPLLAHRSDRRSRRDVVVMFGAAQVVLLALTATLVSAHVPLVFVAMSSAVYAIADAAQKPAQAALMLHYARTPTELAAANARWGVVDNAAFLGGSAIVAIAVGVGGVPAGFWICLVPLSAALAGGLRLSPDEVVGPVDDGPGPRQMLAGVATAMRQPQLRLALFLHATTMFVEAGVDVLLVVISLKLTGFGRAGPGWLSGAWGVGAVVGGWVVGRFVRRRLRAALIVGTMLGGLPLAVIGIWPSIGSSLSCIGVLGVGFGLLEATLLTLTQRLVPADLAARVYGAQESIAMFSMMGASAGVAAIVEAFGARAALISLAAVLPVCAAIGGVGLRRLGETQQVDESTYSLLRGVPAFAPLPVVTVESLTLRCEVGEVPAGLELITQGEDGDSFHVIEHGEVEVFVDGARRRTQGSGEHFGEIALLHRTPRTATVRTLTPVRLVTLGRDEFLAAVGMSPRSRSEIDRSAAERLVAGRDGAG